MKGTRRQLRALFEHLEPNWRASGAIFVTDALDHYDRHAFVDEVHYSADASRLIAETIASRLGLRRAGALTQRSRKPRIRVQTRSIWSSSSRNDDGSHRPRRETSSAWE